MIFALGSVVYRYMTTTSLQAKSANLNTVNNYNISRLTSAWVSDNASASRNTLEDILKFEEETHAEYEQSSDYRDTLSIPYQHFLHLIYTPSINIWKDPFSGELDTSLVGKKFLDNNPFGDIALITSWTNFFKNVGLRNAYNDIDNIRVWDTKTSSVPGYFTMPVSVNFKTPDKRSFFLLVNKISATAYTENIALINEFSYNLRNSIQIHQEDRIVSAQEALQESGLDLNENDTIAYLLYEWIHWTGDNVLIAQEVIDESIKNTAKCTNESKDQCLYIFRSKFKSIPYLAYGVGRDDVNQIDGLQFFFKNLAPIISIKEFSFRQRVDGNNRPTWEYEGMITIEVYGKDIDNTELDELAKKLWSMCFNNNQDISTANASARITQSIDNLWTQNINLERSQILNQALDFISKISGEYDSLTNYKKAIRIFEMYRTLQENNTCDIIDDTIHPDLEDDTQEWLEDLEEELDQENEDLEEDEDLEEELDQEPSDTEAQQLTWDILSGNQTPNQEETPDDLLNEEILTTNPEEESPDEDTSSPDLEEELENELINEL